MRKILVLKTGTKNLMTNGRLDQAIFNDIARQVVFVDEQCGQQVLIVSSAAIQAGRERVAELGFDVRLFNKKDLAGLGARHLLNRWGNAFAFYGREISQFWLTYANWQDAAELHNIKTGMLNCLALRLTPVINESDVIADEEIISMEKGIGENDRLARMVAVLVAAGGILFLTDAGGIYEEDPQLNPKARMYEEINPFVSFETGESSEVSVLGRGGAKAKIAEARICYLAGMKVAIAGMEEDVLIRFSRGEKVGTTLGRFSRFK